MSDQKRVNFHRISPILPKFIFFVYAVICVSFPPSLSHRVSVLFLSQYLLMILACILSFGHSLWFHQHEFVFDDNVAIARNTDVTNTTQTAIQALQKIASHDFWGQDIGDKRSHKSYRPFVTFLYHLEHRIFDAQTLPAIMKRINLLFHCGICCILYDLLRRMLKESNSNMILTAVVLFAVHPIHTENICSVVGRADLICTFFFVCNINKYLDIIEGEMVTKKPKCRKKRFSSVQSNLHTSCCVFTEERHPSNSNASNMQMIVLFGTALVSLFSKETGIAALVSVFSSLLVNECCENDFSHIFLLIFVIFQPFCMLYDLLNCTIPIIPKKSSRDQRLKLLIHTNERVFIRCAKLLGMMVILMFLRIVTLNFQLPQFTSEENPIAAHPDLVTRVM